MKAMSIMEDLTSYYLEMGGFDHFACLDIMLLYIECLLKRIPNFKTLKLLKKVIEARDKRLGQYHQLSIAAYYYLPGLQNKLHFYEEAVVASKEVI